MSIYAFPTDPELVAVAALYKNAAYVADSVFPRQPVGKREFRYYSYPVAESFLSVEDAVGRRSRPNQIDFSAAEVIAGCEDHALDAPVPQDDINNAPKGYDPIKRAAMHTMDYIFANREVRAAALAFNAANYPAANKVVLSGASQWSDVTSTPIATIKTGIDACLMPPNCMLIGRAAWTKLSQHPDILKAVNQSSGDKGVAARQAVADMFELDEVVVGNGWTNTAKKGQPAVLSRIWGKHALLYYRDLNADNNGGLTFGFTAEFGDKIGGQIPDPNISADGGIMVRSGERVKEVIVANQAAYFIENAVA